MRSITIIILSILSVHISYSQINEIGVFIGGSNFIGDVGATNYIAPNQLAIGGLYRLIFTDLKGIDAKSNDPRRIQRDYKFSTKLTEISAGMEFTFLDFNLHSGKKMATPYLYSGLSVAHHDNYYFLNGVQTSESTSSWAFGIPMALGLKANFLDSFVFSIEVGARYTFSDNLEGNYPKDPAKKPYRFGNLNNNDWYMFSGISLTYTFGKNPCYCEN